LAIEYQSRTLLTYESLPSSLTSLVTKVSMKKDYH